jgi:hypothetical protein
VEVAGIGWKAQSSGSVAGAPPGFIGGVGESGIGRFEPPRLLENPRSQPGRAARSQRLSAVTACREFTRRQSAEALRHGDMNLRQRLSELRRGQSLEK